jgi:hypothetical protein
MVSWSPAGSPAIRPLAQCSPGPRHIPPCVLANPGIGSGRQVGRGDHGVRDGGGRLGLTGRRPEHDDHRCDSIAVYIDNRLGISVTPARTGRGCGCFVDSAAGDGERVVDGAECALAYPPGAYASTWGCPLCRGDGGDQDGPGQRRWAGRPQLAVRDELVGPGLHQLRRGAFSGFNMILDGGSVRSDATDGTSGCSPSSIVRPGRPGTTPRSRGDRRLVAWSGGRSV